MNQNPVVVKKQAKTIYGLEFTIQNIHVSAVNALRRTILTDIPTYVFKTFPHAENQVIIHKNTSRLNNEVLKQRFSCLPIHLTDFTIPYEHFVFEIDVTNTGTETMYVTTNDFTVKQLTVEQDGKVLPSNPAVMKLLDSKILFPLDPITKMPIVITRLRPKITDAIPAEQLKVQAKISISSARENGCYNVCSTCSYGNSVDNHAAGIAWEQQASTQEFPSDEDQIKHRNNWMLLEGKRHCKPNSFEFVLESLGIYSNEVLIKTACTVMIERLSSIKMEVHESESAMENSKDIKMIADYGIGKMLEHIIYQKYFVKDHNIEFVSFFKQHPHDDESILRIALSTESTLTFEAIMKQGVTDCVELLNKMLQLF